MYNIKGNKVLNNNKIIMEFDNPEDAEHFYNAVNYLDAVEQTHEHYVITSIKEFKEKILDKDLDDKLYVGKFDYERD